jgi:rhodanese-related sulfurtransferase
MKQHPKRNTLSNILYFVMIFTLLFWFAYTKGWILANFQSVTAKEALVMLESNNNVTLLDVRTVEEYKMVGHLPNTILIPLDKLKANLQMLQNVKQTNILVYCNSGNRSVTASRILEKHGFTPINIRGGIIDLQSAGAQVLKSK